MLIILAAGGTGGHLFPAEALAYELNRLGHLVHLVTDDRMQQYTGSFPTQSIHVVSSGTIKSMNIKTIAQAVWYTAKGMWSSFKLIRSLKPSVVVGFGGYPSYPTVKTAQLLSLPTIIHEANAVMGRANRALARRATHIAVSCHTTNLLKNNLADKVVYTGNPVRKSVLELANLSYNKPDHEDGSVNLLVFAGIQGSHYFGHLVPETIKLLPDKMRRRLKLTQQVSDKDYAVLSRLYKQLGVEAELSTFFEDLPLRIAQSHLVLCRSGASTVSELSAIGRPAIMIPFPWSLDQDQMENAKQLECIGGGWIMQQKQSNPESMANLLTKLLSNPSMLSSAALSIRKTSALDAAAQLAELVERCGSVTKKTRK